MKLLATFILATISCAAAAADREVRIEYESEHVSYRKFVTGDRVPANNIAIILFAQEPCPFNIPGQRDALRAWVHNPLETLQLGCWKPTANDGWEFIGQRDWLTQTSTIPWAIYPRALLHDDGSATITEPNYDRVTFVANFFRQHMSEQQQHAYDHANDKP